MRLPLLKSGQESALFAKKKSKKSYRTDGPGSALITPADFSPHTNILDIPSVVIIEAPPQDPMQNTDTNTSDVNEPAQPISAVHIPVNDLSIRQEVPILISDQPLRRDTDFTEKLVWWEPVFDFTKATIEKTRQTNLFSMNESQAAPSHVVGG